MKVQIFALVLIGALAGCSREDTEKTKREVKTDTQKAEREIKKDAHEASREIKKGVDEIKREVKPADHDHK